ncbi:lipopolysaccharide/colanic/teichoic acid biosynthesis glycosyltransferase [Winogradskyella pacifica]|uniref:Lipopolysaccharide/colanic/teichoic acid biosynthesis glycosyltransferase n=1 Tax=Winogradskyella pacifica TaxID=664642 RepID=A0A3D9N3A8_9FLAO|nr:sugar transferase [Winogradskyella pacifica]REE24443.1 lipopolysaccharide/colanic/teichoic acid biosynthesis glycosyltransferase [Winogradskyella pacifica]
MISKSQLKVKRIFDVVVVILFLPLLIFPIILLVLIATIDTKKWGVYSQLRVGQYGKLFRIYKIRTLVDGDHQLGQLESSATSIGKFLRQTKLNELPQLYNVLIGDMSFVGPRPDLQGFADELTDDDRIILKVKPGITGPATLKYRDEEQRLKLQNDPEHYNRTIIWVDKVKINKKYVQNYSFYLDLRLILKSILNK